MAENKELYNLLEVGGGGDRPLPGGPGAAGCGAGVPFPSDGAAVVPGVRRKY